MQKLSKLSDEELRTYEQANHAENSGLFDRLHSGERLPMEARTRYRETLDEYRRILREWNRRDKAYVRKMFGKRNVE